MKKQKRIEQEKREMERKIENYIDESKCDFLSDTKWYQNDLLSIYEKGLSDMWWFIKKEILEL